MLHTPHTSLLTNTDRFLTALSILFQRIRDEKSRINIGFFCSLIPTACIKKTFFLVPAMYCFRLMILGQNSSILLFNSILSQIFSNVKRFFSLFSFILLKILKFRINKKRLFFKAFPIMCLLAVSFQPICSEKNISVLDPGFHFYKRAVCVLLIYTHACTAFIAGRELACNNQVAGKLCNKIAV